MNGKGSGKIARPKLNSLRPSFKPLRTIRNKIRSLIIFRRG
jgi:hypothetical protein